MSLQKIYGLPFFIDGLISVGFGLISWMMPRAVFSTLVELDGVQDDSLIFATLASVSLFYVLIGLICFASIFMEPPHINRLAYVMILRHIWVGSKGFFEIGSSWLIGNPWPDIVIHACFVAAYLSLLFVLRRHSSNSARSN